MAFKDPNSNEIVFVFRGTENFEGLDAFSDDWLTDLTLGMWQIGTIIKNFLRQIPITRIESMERMSQW